MYGFDKSQNDNVILMFSGYYSIDTKSGRTIG